MLETGQVHNIWRHSFRYKEIAVKGLFRSQRKCKKVQNLEIDHYTNGNSSATKSYLFPYVMIAGKMTEGQTTNVLPAYNREKIDKLDHQARDCYRTNDPTRNSRLYP